MVSKNHSPSAIIKAMLVSDRVMYITALNRITYALPEWSLLLIADLPQKVNSFCRAMPCIRAAYAVVRCPSVRLSDV